MMTLFPLKLLHKSEAYFVERSLVVRAEKYLEYLEEKRKGTRKLPPETIIDTSPLIRSRFKEVKPISSNSLSVLLYHHLNRICLGNEDLSAHSLRKFFHTALNISRITMIL